MRWGDFPQPGKRDPKVNVDSSPRSPEKLVSGGCKRKETRRKSF